MRIQKIIIDKQSAFGKYDTPFPGEVPEVDQLMANLKPGTLIIASYVKPLVAWQSVIRQYYDKVLLITGETKKKLFEIMDGKNISPDYIILATDTVTYGTSFDLYHTLILLDTPWSRGKLLQRIYRIIRRGADNDNKQIIIITTPKKENKLRLKFGEASLVEAVSGLEYKKSW